MTVHEAERENVKQDIKPDHDFLVSLEQDEFTEEKFALFENYQGHVHHEGPAEITRTGFRRFLCSSPIHRVVDTDGKQLGSFHQCYRLDGRLIAMAVLDLLPHAVSGVYFIYHSDFEKWSFGKLSAVREATLALEQNYQYYYMGYYIHTCKKMRYKGDYRPQYVLDLENLQWDPLDDAMREVMDKRKFASMSKERARIAAGKQDDPEAEEEIMYPDPQDAMHAVNTGVALVDMKIPGVLTADQLHEQIDLDTLKIYLGENIPVFETQVCIALNNAPHIRLEVLFADPYITGHKWLGVAQRAVSHHRGTRRGGGSEPGTRDLSPLQRRLVNIWFLPR